MTIRSKLILLYSGLLAIIIVAFSVSVYAVARWVLVDSVDNTLSATADQIWRNSRAYEISEFGAPSRIVIALPGDLDFFRASGVVVQVWQLGDSTPVLLRASSNLGGYSDPLDTQALQTEDQRFKNSDNSLNSSYTTVNIGNSQWRVLTLPYDVRGWRVVIQASTSFDTVNQASQGLLGIIVVATGIALACSMVLGMALANRVLKSISDITHSAEQITTAGDPKSRLDWKGPPDELGHLVSVFNRALERLDQLFSVQQRFVADVSHELRTPLTAIQGHVELMQRYGMDEESMEAVESEVKRMSRMVNDLLLLARADNGELTLNRQPLELDEVFGEAYREARVLAKDRDLKVTMVDFEPVRIDGDADRLKQLLSNLVGNAIKFTPDGGEIRMSLRKTDHDAVMQVQDTGIGIKSEDMRRIFDRFYQADSSRVRLGGEGAGLGLSIAQWIAQAHGGRIDVESATDTGTTFTVTIPHLEEPEQAADSAVTRSRLGIMHRSSPPEKIKP